MHTYKHTSRFSYFALGATLVAAAISFVMIALAMREPDMAVIEVNRDMRVATYLNDARNSILLSYNIAQAEKSYKKVIAIDPTNEEALYELARVYLVEGKYQEGLALAARFNVLYPDKTRILYVGGLVAGYGGNLPLAEQLFSSYIQNEKTASWPSRLDLSWVLIQEGKFTEAETALTEQLVEHANNPWLLNNLGVAQMGQDKFADAIKTLINAKKSVAQLSEDEWTRNYSFNNPGDIKVSLGMFKQIVGYNLDKARHVGGATPPNGFAKIGSASAKGVGHGIAVSACGESCGPVLCTSPANACGQVRQVTINTCLNPSWTCSGTEPPYLPANYGQTCSGTNSCGISGTGTIGCDGSCRVTVGLPAQFGQTCIIRNSCGETRGTIGCNGACSATRTQCQDDDVIIIGDDNQNSSGTPDSSTTGSGMTVYARISALPVLIHRGQTSNIKWETQNTVSCTVTGNTGTAVDTWQFATGNSSHISSSIIKETEYTLSCLGKNGQQLRSSVTIRIVPDWQEI